MSKFLSAVSALLAQAKESEATPEQIKNLKQNLKIQFNWNPTKKVITKAKRIAKRKMQKESRRRNRGTGRGISNRKGQYYST